MNESSKVSHDEHRPKEGRMHRTVFLVDRFGQYLFPVLMGLIVLDVVGRRLLSLPTVAIQEAQWHVHGAIFLFCIAATYLKNRHVRVEILRERFSPRLQAGIELAGNLLFVLSYMALLCWLSVDFATQSFLNGEGSPAAEGLPMRWIIKSMMVIGFTTMILASILVCLASLRTLRGEQP